MRRGIGAAAIVKRRERDSKINELGGELHKERVENAREIIDTFRDRLGEFASKYRSEIRQDAEFREQFVMMCESVGVDPFRSSKSVWSDVILGIGTYYSDLAVQVLTICMTQKSIYGSLLPLSVCMTLIQGENVSVKDITRAIKTLDVFGGGGIRIVDVGREQFIASTPEGFGVDGLSILGSFKQFPLLTLEELTSQLGWSRERTLVGVQALVKDGSIWIDQHLGIRKYAVFSQYIRSIN